MQNSLSLKMDFKRMPIFSYHILYLKKKITCFHIILTLTSFPRVSHWWSLLPTSVDFDASDQKYN